MRLPGILGAAVLAATLLPAPAPAQQSVHAFTLAPGPYGVGFRAVEQRDPGRPFKTTLLAPAQDRPVQTSVWYPARPARSPRTLRYRDYVHLEALRTGFEPLTPARRAEAERAIMRLVGASDAAAFARELEAPTGAVRNARQAPGTFPVVVYGPSFNAPSWENSVLAEYLASHGYIVVSSPSLGATLPHMTFDSVGAEAQVRDMQVLLRYVRGLRGADTTRIAAMGFSWGGLSNVLLQMRNPAVRAVVSLDGSVWYSGEAFRSQLADTDRMDVPFLFLRRKPFDPAAFRAHYGGDTTFAFFHGLRRSEAYLVDFPALVHTDFSSHFLRLMPRDTAAGDTEQATANRGYEAVALYTLRFLEAHLRGDAGARAFLERTPEENGLPAGFARVTRRHPADAARRVQGAEPRSR